MQKCNTSRYSVVPKASLVPLVTGQSNTFNQEETINVNRNKAKQVMMVREQGGKTGNRRKEIKSGKCHTLSGIQFKSELVSV
jgi:hypothetical protein